MPSTTVLHLDAIALLQNLPPGSVRAIITDPPYGIAYHSNYYAGRNPHKPVANDWNFRVAELFAAASRALGDGGVLYLFTRWDVYPIWVAEIQDGPLALKNCIVWVKDNWSAGDLKGNFGGQYEMLMFLTKGRHRLCGHRWPNVWEFPRIPAKRLRIPTEKPVDLICRAIESSTNPSELVVDPFCGSGTTGEAAVKVGRDVVLGDIDPEMVRMSCSRLGVPEPDGLPAAPKAPVSECPVFRVEPPAPHLWGVHPEDLAWALEKNRITGHTQGS